MSRNRTQAAAKNLAVSIIMQVLTFLLAWLSRVMITRTLSASYLGIGSLYSDILSVLQLSELGIGTAMLSALYKPAADGDTAAVRRILQFYRVLYRFTALVITAGGLLMMPFLPLLVKGLDAVDHPYIYYLMFLAETVLTYFCSWKNSLFYVYQEQYVLSFWNGVYQVIRYVLQVIVLLLTRNYLLFVLIQTVFAFLPAYMESRIAQRRRPELIGTKDDRLSKTEKKQILSGVGAMSMHKVGGVLVNNTDSLIMSAFLGLTTVGIYTNYRIVINALTRFMKQCVDAFTGGVGNLSATEDGEHVYRVYREIYFLSVLGYGFCACLSLVLFPDFITVGYGRDYLLGTGTVLLIVADFYTKGMRVPILTFRDAAGLFRYDRYKPVFEILINLVTSIWLVKPFGVAGIVMGTLISYFSTSFWVDPLVFLKEGVKTDWKRKYRTYFLEYLENTAVLAAQAALAVYLTAKIPLTGFAGLIVKGAAGTVLYAGTAAAVYGRREEMKKLRERAKKLIRSKK